jgi:small subunit ribosomal protein S17
MERGRPKARIAVVTSNRMEKTVVVQVERRVRHAKYGKFMVRRMKYKAHDEKSECGVGDKVRIVETRPLSKDKRWRVAQILEKAKAV